MKCKKCGKEFLSFLSDICPFCGADNITTWGDVLSSLTSPTTPDKGIESMIQTTGSTTITVLIRNTKMTKTMTILITDKENCDCTLQDYVDDNFDGDWDLYEANSDDD